MVDEVQVDRQLAKAISHACELTFTDINVLVIPVFAGIQPPGIRIDPSGPLVRNVFINPLQESDEVVSTLERSFCKAIHGSVEVLKTSPNLFDLLAIVRVNWLRN